MQLSLNKTYVNRLCHRRTIVHFDRDDCALPWQDNAGDWYRDNGSFSEGFGYTDQDLIHEATNAYSVKLPDSVVGSLAVLRLLGATGVTNGCSAAVDYIARKAEMVVVRDNVIVDWFHSANSYNVQGQLFDSTRDPVSAMEPVDTSITFADGTNVELSLESYNRMRGA